MRKGIYNVLKVLCLSIIVLACNPVNKEIDRNSMEKDIAKIKEKIKGSDPDSVKINMLDEFLSISKDREYYIAFQKRISTGDYSLEKYVVPDDIFKERSAQFFAELKAKKYTYNQLFKELDEIEAIKNKYYKELEPIYKQIDSLCCSFQKYVDGSAKRAELFKDSLNKIVDLKLVSIYQTRIDYSDVIAVRIELINKTNKPIEAISFQVDLTDKLGSMVATLNCKTNNRFTKSYVGVWSYGRYDKSEIYNSLLNVSASNVTMKKQINKINLDGELLGVDIDNLTMGDYLKYRLDYQYKSPLKKLSGYCPYLVDDNPYNKKASEIEVKRSSEIKNGNFPIMKLWNEFTIFDFSK